MVVGLWLLKVTEKEKRESYDSTVEAQKDLTHTQWFCLIQVISTFTHTQGLVLPPLTAFPTYPLIPAKHTHKLCLWIISCLPKLTLIFTPTLVYLEVYVRVRRSSYIYWRQVNEGGAWVTKSCAAILTPHSHLLHPNGTIYFRARKALTKPSRSRMNLLSSVGKQANPMRSSWAWKGNTVDDKLTDITQCASPKTVRIAAQSESCLSCFTSTFCPFPNMHIFITWVSQTHYSVFPPSGLCIFSPFFFFFVTCYWLPNGKVSTILVWGKASLAECCKITVH